MVIVIATLIVKGEMKLEDTPKRYKKRVIAKLKALDYFEDGQVPAEE